jgi:hypothetical protein
MDENYENRPPAKNSGLATAEEAGVRDTNKKHDQETEAFLASVKHSSVSGITSNAKSDGGENNKAVYVKTKPQSVVPPPPPKPNDKTSSSISSPYEYSSNSVESEVYANNGPSSNFNYDKGYEYNSANEFDSATQTNFSPSSLSDSDWSNLTTSHPKDMISSSFSESHAAHAEEKHAPSSLLNMNDYVDDSTTSGELAGSDATGQQSQEYSSSYGNGITAEVDNISSTDGGYQNEYSTQSSFGESSYSNAMDPEKSFDKEKSVYSSSQSSKPLSQQSASISSAFDQSMTTQDVKSVYKDAFFRWNHPFRHGQTEDINGGIDLPVFWRIPRSASGVVEATMSYCYGLTLASALGAGFQDEVNMIIISLLHSSIFVLMSALSYCSCRY